MTKAVRIENADTSDYPFVVQVWERGTQEGERARLIREIKLSHPTAMETFYLYENRWIIIKGLPQPVEYTDPVFSETDESKRYLEPSFYVQE